MPAEYGAAFAAVGVSAHHRLLSSNRPRATHAAQELGAGAARTAGLPSAAAVAYRMRILGLLRRIAFYIAGQSAVERESGTS